MKITKIETVEQSVIEKIVCDACHKEILPDDIIEWQESYTIDFIAGYGSVFGDMNHITFDLCQNCLFDLIGNYCQYNEKGY